MLRQCCPSFSSLLLELQDDKAGKAVFFGRRETKRGEASSPTRVQEVDAVLTNPEPTTKCGNGVERRGGGEGTLRLEVTTTLVVVKTERSGDREATKNHNCAQIKFCSSVMIISTIPTHFRFRSASTNFHRHGKQQEIWNSLSFVSLSSPHLWRERGLLGPISPSWIIRKLELLPPSRGEERAKPPKRGEGRKTAIGRQGNKEKMGRGGGFNLGSRERGGRLPKLPPERRLPLFSTHQSIFIGGIALITFLLPAPFIVLCQQDEDSVRIEEERLIHSPTDKKDFPPSLSPILPPFVHRHPPLPPQFH